MTHTEIGPFGYESLPQSFLLNMAEMETEIFSFALVNFMSVQINFLRGHYYWLII